MESIAPAGPAPATDRDDLPDTRRRCLRALEEHPDATVNQVQAILGGHANTARLHLDALVADGLAVSHTRPAGPGRPAVRYRLTQLGRAAALDGSGVGAAQGLGALVEVLLGDFSDRPDPGADARALGTAWGRRLAEDCPEGEDADSRLLALLRREGYAPEAREQDIALLRCPLLSAAEEHPQVVCAMHEGLIDGAYAALGGSRRLRLHPFAAPDACLCREEGRD